MWVGAPEEDRQWDGEFVVVYGVQVTRFWSGAVLFYQLWFSNGMQAVVAWQESEAWYKEEFNGGGEPVRATVSSLDRFTELATPEKPPGPTAPWLPSGLSPKDWFEEGGDVRLPRRWRP